MDKEQFYKEFFRYLECGSCADLEFCQKQLEPACKTGLAIYRKLKMEDLEKENEQLKQQLAEKEKEIAVLEEQDGVYHNQTAIEKLENVKEFIIKNNEPTKKMTNITRFINQKINDLRGE